MNQTIRSNCMQPLPSAGKRVRTCHEMENGICESGIYHLTMHSHIKFSLSIQIQIRIHSNISQKIFPFDKNDSVPAFTMKCNFSDGNSVVSKDGVTFRNVPYK